MEANLWQGREMPGESEIPLLNGVAFHLIKPYSFAEDGYRFLHGVAVAWHKGRLFASFGHNRGPENTATEEARGRVSDDGGSRWGDLFTIASAPEPGLAVSHGVFCSQLGELWAFHGAYRGTMEQVHTRAYVLDEVTGQWRERGVIVEGGFWPLQEPVRMADGNLIMAGIAVRGDCPAGGIHPPAVAISHGDDFMRWDLIVIPCLAPGNVWGESTVFVNGRRVVNVARYGEEPRALMAVSEDFGRSWSPAIPSNLPMTTSKPCCGTLGDGRHYLIGTTTADGGVRRTPLTIALTRPGESRFSSVFAIRHAECTGGAVESHPGASLSYPYAVEHEGKLYVGYSNSGGGVGRVGEGRELWNNNSAELAVIPIASLNTPESGNVSQSRKNTTKGYPMDKESLTGMIPPVVGPFNARGVNFTPGPEYADANRCFGIASSIARTPGGRLWCGFTSGGNGEGQLNYGIVVRSDDDGATWSSPSIVFDAHDEGLIRSDHVTVWTAPSGALWIMWSRYPTNLCGSGSSLWCIMSDNPDAAAPRWSAPRKLVDGQNLLTTPTVLADGTWIFPTGCWNRSASPSRPLFSHDQGATFELGGPLHAAQDPDFDEYMIVERTDKRLVVFNRHSDSFLQCESADGGRSWTRQEPNGIRHTNSRFVFLKLTSSNWLLVKQGRLDWVSDAQEERTSQRGRSHLTAYLSGDEGKSWKGGLLLDERECSYPFGAQADNGSIYVSYERNRWRQPEILFARFTEADVLAGKLVSSRATLRRLVNKAVGVAPLPDHQTEAKENG